MWKIYIWNYNYLRQLKSLRQKQDCLCWTISHFAQCYQRSPAAKCIQSCLHVGKRDILHPVSFLLLWPIWGYAINYYWPVCLNTSRNRTGIHIIHFSIIISILHFPRLIYLNQYPTYSFESNWSWLAIDWLNDYLMF